MQPRRRATGATSRKLIALRALVAVVVVGGGPPRLGRRRRCGDTVRAIFDNGGFMVNGELVRVAGANVGEIKSVGVTMPGEVDSYKNGKPQAVRAKR